MRKRWRGDAGGQAVQADVDRHARRAWCRAGGAAAYRSAAAARIDALVSVAGLRCEPGDALIVRTGSLRAYRSGEPQERAWPGLGADCVDWIREKRISIIGGDNMAVEVVPSGDPGIATRGVCRPGLRGHADDQSVTDRRRHGQSGCTDAAAVSKMQGQVRPRQGQSRENLRLSRAEPWTCFVRASARRRAPALRRE